MTDLDILLREYASFEEKVRTAMTAMCVVNCSRCARVCCREELCRETLESPFLRLLWQNSPPATTYSSKTGWLTETGCALSFGRAPVCYHFLCNDILTSQPSPVDVYIFETLAALINHIGQNALGPRHLVAITDHDKLYRIKYLRFEKKLNEARAAFRVITDYFEHGMLDEGRATRLSRIQPFPRTLQATGRTARQPVWL